MPADQPRSPLNPTDFVLRKLALADLPQVIRQLNDPHIAGWLAAVPHPFQPEDATELLASVQPPDNHARVIASQADPDEVLGCLCLGTNTWFWLAPGAWGQGVMQAALEQAIPAFFARNPCPIYASARDDNAASRAVLQKLGFAQLPAPRRMFFHGAGRSFLCRDFVLSPEQWVLRSPPVVDAGGAELIPATRRSIPALAGLLPGHAPWPASDELVSFVDRFRYRGADSGLFLIRDDTRRVIGAALLAPPAEPEICLPSQADDEQYAEAAKEALLRLTQRP